MGFQVNGSTIIDSSRNFASSAFPKTVNGQSIIGSGEMQYVRPTTNHVVGDFIISGVNQNSINSTFVGGTSHAGSIFSYENDQPFRAYWLYTSTTSHAMTLAGTWRVCSYALQAEYNNYTVNCMWARSA